MAKDLTPPSGTFSFFLLAFLLTLTGQGLVVAGLWRFLEAGASGLQTSVLTLVQALASILTPFLLQSWLETRPQMVLRLLAFGLGVAALLALGSPGLSTFLLLYAALLALFLFLTAALAIYGVLLGSALPRLFPKEALSQANARWEMANTLGLVLAPLIGGFAVDRLGPYALPLFALPLGVALVLLLGLKAPPPLGPSEGRRKAFGGVPLGVLLPVALPALLPALALTGGGVLTALLFHDLKRPEGLGIAWAGSVSYTHLTLPTKA
jgi:MFS family permease